ncbi:MAG: hypothetical protein EOM50_13015 [Erysipelotrichia bacterium]|nr:hypothetical protein [Erysipelotrichia bacterium]
MTPKKTISIPLNKAPICLSFLQRIMDFSGCLKISDEVLSQVSITGMCQCQQKDCSTFYLKRSKEWSEEAQGAYLIDSSKGITIIHLGKKGYMEVEALMYDDFPYRAELKRVLKSNFKDPAPKEYAKLDAYFSDLASGDMQTIVLDE